MGTRGQGLDGTEPDEDERAVLKRDLLAGHLLSMAFQVHLQLFDRLPQPSGCWDFVMLKVATPNRLSCALHMRCCYALSAVVSIPALNVLQLPPQDRSRLPPHAMPSIAAHLRQRSLLQPWVERLLLTQPELFNRAFQRLFAQVSCSSYKVFNDSFVCSCDVWHNVGHEMAALQHYEEHWRPAGRRCRQA